MRAEPFRFSANLDPDQRTQPTHSTNLRTQRGTMFRIAERMQQHRGADAMLTKQQNDVLAETGPGTLMGNLFRCYWLPVLLAEELPDNDCPPVRVKVLSERLVAFRDT